MEPVKFSEVMRFASNLSVLVPLTVYFYRIRYASRQVHVIGLLLIVSGLCDLAGFILLKDNQPTTVLFNIYYLLLFLLLTWFYYHNFFDTLHRIMIWVGLAVYIPAFILVSLYVQNFSEYQTMMWLVTAVIMIIYSIAYFFHSLTTITGNAFSAYGLIWINIGVMIYFCMNLFLFVMANYVLTELDPETSKLIWSSHNINNILKNVLFAIGIFYCRKSAPAL